MSNLFQKLEYEAFRAGINPRTKESREWFRRRLSTMQRTPVNRRELMREDPIERRNVRDAQQIIGNMYMFFYDAKHRDTLPYWDAFPLIIAAGKAKGGFYGLNIHYLPLPLRAKFLDNLMEITTNNRFDDTTRIKAKYNLLQSSRKFRYFQPCWKHYLTTQVEGKLAYVPPPEWEIAIFLPTAQGQKGKASDVYKDSRSMLRDV